MNFKSSVLTAIQQIEVKCSFLASAIENGNYLTIQVHFDGNFDGNYFAKAMDKSLDDVSTFDNFSVTFEMFNDDILLFLKY